MNERASLKHRLATFAMYVWLVGGVAYYLVRFSRSFYMENEMQIRQAVSSLLGS